MADVSIQRQIGRLTHPIRTARAVLERLQRHEHHPRYWLMPGLLDRERERARTAGNVVVCRELEMSLSGIDWTYAAQRLEQTGCLLLRGTGETRAAIRAFRDVIGERKAPWGDALMNLPEGHRLPLHRMVQREIYPLLQLYFGTDLLMSTTQITATLRGVMANKKGLTPFHQDISPVSIERSLTCWLAISPETVGRDAPGLRFIASTTGKRTRRMSHDTDATGYHETKLPGLRDGEFFWTPEIQAGDLMLFDAFCCHASYSTETMTLPRVSLDLRVSAFEQKQAQSFLGAGHGLVLFDRDKMIGPAA